MRVPPRLALAAALAAFTPAARAQPPDPKPAPPGRVRIVLNAALWPTEASSSDSRTLTEYAEQTTIRTSYETGAGLGPDAAVQVSLYRGFGLLLGLSHASRDVTGRVDVSRPHPLYLGRDRSASAEISGYGYAETAVHADLAWARSAGRLDWAVFAGATFFRVEADLLGTPAYTDVYPYDQLVVAATPSTTVRESPTGFNVGGRLDYRFGSAGRLGAGVQVLYSAASATLRATPESTGARFDTGGLSIGAGLRLYF